MRYTWHSVMGSVAGSVSVDIGRMSRARHSGVSRAVQHGPDVGIVSPLYRPRGAGNQGRPRSCG